MPEVHQVHNKVPADLAQLEGLAPSEMLQRAGALLAGRIAFASSFGLEDQVILDLIVRSGADIPVFTIDTGRLHPQTLQLIDDSRRHFGVRIEVLQPDAAEVEAMVSLHGPDLFHASVENRRLCCRVRKVDVLKRRLAGLGAWVCGLRREQSVTREGVRAVQWDAANGLVKISPLIDWTTDQVWARVRQRGLPYNPLHDEGFPSIGCQPCTRAVRPGEDIRSGRWWWESPEHRECGLHVVGGRLVRKAK